MCLMPPIDGSIVGCVENDGRADEEEEEPALVDSRSLCATLCDSVASHSASHCALLQPLSSTLHCVPKPIAGLSSALFSDPSTCGCSPLTNPTARSTSLQRRNLSAASPLTIARVSGERKSPWRRARGEEGLKSERRVRVRELDGPWGRRMMGM